jgi:hypothetical protein
MAYWVKRIALRTGELVTEKELRPDENLSSDPAPVVGDELLVTCGGRTFKARVVWRNWDDGIVRNPNDHVVPLRVVEV